jgi:hypothetical protein
MLRIEISMHLPFQMLTCEICDWTSIRSMGPCCPSCGIRFNAVTLLLDGECVTNLVSYATSERQLSSINR